MPLQMIGTTGFVSGTGSLSVAVSTTGAQSGDLLLAFVCTANQGGVLNPFVDASSFTPYDGGGQGYPAVGTAGSAGAVDLRVFYKIYTSGTNITYGDSGSYQAMAVVALRGVRASPPFSSYAHRSDASATTTCTVPFSTAPAVDQWLVQAIGLDRDTSNADYAVFQSFQYGSFQANFVNGAGNINGAVTNAGAGGGLFACAFADAAGMSGTFNDSTTHAYIAFYINEAPATPAVTQAAYRFYADDAGGESGSATLANQNVGVTANVASADVSVVARMLLQTTEAVAGSTFSDWQLQYDLNSSGTWNNVVVGSGPIQAYSTNNLLNGGPTTNRLTGGSGTFVAGKVSEDGAIEDLGWSASNFTEVLYTVKVVSASVSDGDVYRLRVLRDGVTTNLTFSQYPTITASKSTGAATLSTTTGGATAAGQSGALTATRNPTFSTLTGDAVAAGQQGAITGQTNATFSTLTGNAVSAGQAGALKGGATFSATTTGNAVSAGQQGAITGVRNPTLSTLTGGATAAGESGALKGSATFSATTTGDATAAGQAGALRSSPTFTTLTGDAVAGGQAGALKGSATLATLTGDATAAGGTGAITGGSGQVDGALTTLTGSAAAAGEAGALRGGATLTTLAGDAVAAGESGALTATRSPTLSTLTGDAAAAGEAGALTATRNPTFSTVTGDATAAGQAGALTATRSPTLTTLTGDATAAGGAGAMNGGASLVTSEGSASSAGESGALTGGATFSATVTGDATASGGTGAITGSESIPATFTTLTGDAPAAGLSGDLRGGGVLASTTGDATAAGQAGALTGTISATLSTATGDATAAGQDGALTGVRNPTLATLTGNAVAAGGVGAITGEGQTATISTQTGDAVAAGRLGTMWTTSVVTDEVTAYGGSASGNEWVDPANATGAPNDTYATWTSSVGGDTSPDLVIASFGAWGTIPAGATIDSVDVAVQHHESHTGSPIASVTGQVYLDTTPLDSPTSFTLSLTDRDDTVNPALTLAQLQGGTLAVHVAVARTGG